MWNKKMKNKILKSGSLLLAVFISHTMPVLAQDAKWGTLNGSVEANMGFFQKDKKLGNLKPEDKFAINTWLNLNYAFRDFRAGLQYEIFEPPMPGYSDALKGNRLTQGFVEYAGKGINIRGGNYYEQFGNGLLFRSYEERSLGINTSLLGGWVCWRSLDWLIVKALAGKPRENLKYSDSWVYGGDVEFSLDALGGFSETCFLSVGGSFLRREDKDDSNDKYYDYPKAVNGWAGRFSFNKGIWTVDGEYVHRGEILLYYPEEVRFVQDKGSALFLHLGIDGVGTGFSAEFRRLERMEFRINNQLIEDQASLNYLPALTKQHKYTLAGLYPYLVQSFGEIGGQIDFFHEWNRGCLEKNPLWLNMNASWYNGLDGEAWWREIGFETEKEWGATWKTILAFYFQSGSEFVLEGGRQDYMVKSSILVGDVTWKISRRHSLRMELQHMWTDMKGDKAWYYGLVEYGFSPHWMVSVSDLCNYQTDGESIHYFNVGGSFSSGIFRGTIAYARNRAGFSCVGGICRFVPDYTGVNLSLSVIF